MSIGFDEIYLVRICNIIYVMGLINSIHLYQRKELTTTKYKDYDSNTLEWRLLI